LPSFSTSCCSDFTGDYDLNAHPVFRAVEREVLGCSYGGTSWTTREQADAIAGELSLGPHSHLLEIGSGAGWPGVYVAGQAGCHLTMLDLPLNALARARNAAEDDLAGNTTVLQASGAALPLRDATADAIAHSDVLCCLAEKREMLAECRRVLRPGGRMLFYVIAPAEDLRGDDLIEAREAGPPFVELPGDYRSLLRKTGWQSGPPLDLTEDYLGTLQRMVESLQSHAADLRDCLGDAEFDETLERRRRQVAAVQRGLLVRERYLAVTA